MNNTKDKEKPQLHSQKSVFLKKNEADLSHHWKSFPSAVRGLGISSQHCCNDMILSDHKSHVILRACGKIRHKQP